MTIKKYSIEEINKFYDERHQLRPDFFGEMPYANYGYWAIDGISIDEAGNALTDLVAKELEINSKDRILECGCGYGASATYVALNYHPEKIVGLDVSALRIEEANHLVKEKELEQVIEIKFGDATNLDFPPASFSKVMAIECAFHFSTRKDFFQEAFRVLSPQGILTVVDIIPAPELKLEDYTNSQIREFLAADTRFYSDDNIYDLDTYTAYLEEAGFSQIKIYSIKNKVFCQFADYLDSITVKDPEISLKKSKYADHFRNQMMVYGDYIVAVAKKSE